MSTVPRSIGYWQRSWERLSRDRLGMASGLLIVIFALIAMAAPLFTQLVTHHAFDDPDLSHVFAVVGTPGHLLGTDELGRDTLTRLVYGARVSLGVGFLTVVLYILIGSTVGVVAGYYGRWIDGVLMRCVDALLSIPTLYLLILIASLLPVTVGSLVIRHDAVSLSIVIAITAWAGVARLVRAETLSLKSRDFIVATRSVGSTDVRLMVRHILPNVSPVLIVNASLGVGGIILAEAALDFIGLGIQPPTPSWGNMLVAAQLYFFHSVSLVVLPGLCIFLVVIAANIFGNSVRDAFDPRLG